MDLTIADAVQAGGVATFAAVVWYEMHTGMRRVSDEIHQLAEKAATGFQEVRAELAKQREEVASSMALTHERLRVISLNGKRRAPTLEGDEEDLGRKGH